MDALIANTKKDFPIFKKHPNLVYLDSAATALVPQIVLDAMNEYYTSYGVNIHRGLYTLSDEATNAFEYARKKVAMFLNAKPKEIIVTSSATAGLNGLALSLSKSIKSGENIVLSQLEHHANLIPWQQIVKKIGCELRFIELKENTELDLSNLESLIDERTKVVSITMQSNALGTMVDVRPIVKRTRAVGAVSILDASQAIVHQAIDVKQLGCDALVFSGHKLYGPTGIGIVYGRTDFLSTLEPWIFGGDMIDAVSYEMATWKDIPHKFEAGTPPIAEMIGLGVAIDYMQQFSWKKIKKYEIDLFAYALKKLIDQVQIIGPADIDKQCGILSFVIDGIHAHDVAEIFSRHQVAVRAGHHCAMPLMTQLNISGTVRLSFGLYNSIEDIDRVIEVIKETKKIFIYYG